MTREEKIRLALLVVAIAAYGIGVHPLGQPIGGSAVI